MSVIAIDPYTLEIKTRAPFPTMMKGLSFILMQTKRYFDKVGWKGIVAHPMGTGPFVYGKWSAGDRYELTAFKDYWAGPAKVDRLTIREIPDPGTRIASLVAAETHIIEEVPIDLITQVEGSSVAKMDEITSTAGLVLTYDVRVPPFNDPRVRLAFDYAVDKPAIRQAMLKGRGDLLDGQLLTASTFGYNPAVKARPFDPDKARALLKQANYPADTPIPIMTQSGKYVSDIDICNAVAGMLNQVGVNATVDVVEGGVFLQRQSAFKAGPHPHGRLVQPGRRRLRQRLVHARRQALDLVQRGIRAPVRRRPLHERPRLPGCAPTMRMAEILHEENPSMFPVRPAQPLRRQPPGDRLRRRLRQVPASDDDSGGLTVAPRSSPAACLTLPPLAAAGRRSHLRRAPPHRQSGGYLPRRQPHPRAGRGARAPRSTSTSPSLSSS